MSEDIWQMAEEPADEPRRPSTAVRVGRVVAVAAALATIGVGGVAWASGGASHQSTSPAQVSVHESSLSGSVAVHDCPFHSGSSTDTASAQG